MDYIFKKQKIGDVTSLRLDIDRQFEMDEFALNMMNYNEPNHLLPVQLVRRDNVFYLQYDVNGMQPLDSILSEKMEKKDVIHILNSMINAFEETEDYMLSEDAIVLNMGYVYLDEAKKCRFLCIPCKQEGSDNRLSFLRRVIEQIFMCYTDEDTFLYDLLNAFNRDGIRKLSDVKELLRKLDNDAEFIAGREQASIIKKESNASVDEQQMNMLPEREIVWSKEIPANGKTAEEQKELSVGFEVPGREKSESSGSFQIPGRKEVPFSIPDKKSGKGKDKTEDKKRVPQKADDKGCSSKIGIVGKVFKKKSDRSKKIQENQMSMPKMPKSNDVDFSSDMYESYEETVIVSDEELPGMDSEGTRILELLGMSGVLMRKKTQERFFIGEGETVIGAGRTATCVIGNNKAISRQHIILRLEENRVSVMDNDSSNGTWVNGRKLAAGETVFIRDHAVIKLADEEFVFTLNRQ